MSPIPAGFSGHRRNSREAPRAPPPPAYCGARSEPSRAAGALLPALLLAAAADPWPRVFAAYLPCQAQVAGTVF